MSERVMAVPQPLPVHLAGNTVRPVKEAGTALLHYRRAHGVHPGTCYLEGKHSLGSTGPEIGSCNAHSWTKSDGPPTNNTQEASTAGLRGPATHAPISTFWT